MPIWQRVLRVLVLLAVVAALVTFLAVLAQAQAPSGTPEIGTLETLARVFGPVGAVGLVLASVVGFFYRRDVLTRVADAERREDRFVEVLRVQSVTSEKFDHLASAIERLVETQQRGELERARQIGELVHLIDSRRP